MTGTELPAARVRAGGRSERIRRAVASAVLSLLREGDFEFAVAAVAERARTHRSTVYRWWPTRADLVREALTLHTASLAVPDTGTWDSDVAELVAELADFFADPLEMTLNAMLAAGGDGEFDAVQRAHWRPVMRSLGVVVERAQARGEVRSDADCDFVLQMIVGPLLLHTTFSRSPAAPALVDAIAGAVARAFAQPPG